MDAAVSVAIIGVAAYVAYKVVQSAQDLGVFTFKVVIFFYLPDSRRHLHSTVWLRAHCRGPITFALLLTGCSRTGTSGPTGRRGQ